MLFIQPEPATLSQLASSISQKCVPLAPGPGEGTTWCLTWTLSSIQLLALTSPLDDLTYRLTLDHRTDIVLPAPHRVWWAHWLQTLSPWGYPDQSCLALTLGLPGLCLVQVYPDPRVGDWTTIIFGNIRTSKGRRPNSVKTLSAFSALSGFLFPAAGPWSLPPSSGNSSSDIVFLGGGIIPLTAWTG